MASDFEVDITTAGMSNTVSMCENTEPVLMMRSPVLYLLSPVTVCVELRQT